MSGKKNKSNRKNGGDASNSPKNIPPANDSPANNSPIDADDTVSEAVAEPSPEAPVESASETVAEPSPVSDGFTENEPEQDADQPEQDAKNQSDGPSGTLLRHMPTGRRLRQGSYSIAVTVLFIAALVLLNAVFTALGERYSLRLDLTASKVFKLSPESIRFLSELDKDVHLYVLTSEDYFASGNLYYIQAQEVLRQYATRSEHITLEYVDLPKTPGFETRFPQYQLSSYTIILESGSRTSTVSINDLFNTEFDEYYYTQYIVSSKAEQVLTSAIMGVTMEQQVTVALLEGFGETGYETLENILKTNNYNPIRQNILTESINTEAEVAIISAPMRDYTDNELGKLDSYLQNGGAYGKTLLYFPAVLQPETPNLDAFLADWGIAVGSGILYQTDYTRLVTMSNYWSAAEYNEQEFSKAAVERRLLTVVPEARPLSVLFENRDNISVTAPLMFTETMVGMPLEPDENWSPDTAELRGPMPALAMGTLTATVSGDTVESRVLVFGSYEFIGQSMLSSRTVGNLEYILSIFASLTAREDTIFIAPKSIGAQELPVTGNIIIILGIVFVAVLPLTVLILGGVTFFRRRHL